MFFVAVIATRTVAASIRQMHKATRLTSNEWKATLSIPKIPQAPGGLWNQTSAPHLISIMLKHSELTSYDLGVISPLPDEAFLTYFVYLCIISVCHSWSKHCSHIAAVPGQVALALPMAHWANWWKLITVLFVLLTGRQGGDGFSMGEKWNFRMTMDN